MPDILTLFFTYFSQAMIVFFYLNTVYCFKKSKILSFLITVATFLMLMLIYRYVSNHEILSVFLITILNISLAYFVFKSSLKSAIFHGIMLSIIQYTSECLIAYLMAETLNSSSKTSVSEHFAIGAILSRILYFAFSRFLAKLSSKEGNSKSWGRWALLSMLPISSIFVIFVVRNLTAYQVLTQFENAMCIFAIVFLLITNVVVFIIYEYAERSSQKLIELELINQRSNIDLQYLMLLENKNETMKIMAHDYKKHIITIDAMSDSPEIKEYIQGMLGEISQYNQIGKTKNRILDVILSKYAYICKDKEINFNTDIMSDNLSFISSKDVSSLLNNILDNAVEAAEHSEKQDIHLQISIALGAYHKITATNSCDSRPNIQSHKMITIKKNKEVHGFGTKSIIQTVKKYHGELQWNYDEENKELRLIILIPLEQ